MEDKLLLNDFLLLNVNELANTKVRFIISSQYDNPLDLYLQSPEKINREWLLWCNGRRYFDVGQTVIALLRLKGDLWLLTTFAKITRELGVIHGINYESAEDERFKALYGRVIIKHHKSYPMLRLAASVIDQFEVQQILPTTFDGEDFPGYDKVLLSFSKLENIIKSGKRDWFAALSNQKAVYLITDRHNGKHYVGSATAEGDMLLERWSNYMVDGHSGNKELQEISNDPNRGLSYIKQNFQFSILENYNAKVSNDYILARESYWKDTLDSRIHGYNAN
jgi:hypothetical protein